jgi:hypothetical protein
VRSLDLLNEVGGFGFAGVEEGDDRDAVLDCDRLEKARGFIVGLELVGPFARVGADARVDVDQDEARLRVVVQPVDELRVAAFVEAWPFGLDPEPLRGAVAVEQETEPFLQSAGVVLEGEVEDVSLSDVDLAEGDAAASHADPEAERKPALAELRRAGHEREAFGEQTVYGPAWLGKVSG